MEETLELLGEDLEAFRAEASASTQITTEEEPRKRFKPALVNKVVFALMSGLPFKTSFKNGVELVKGFLDAAIDLVPAAVFQ